MEKVIKLIFTVSLMLFVICGLCGQNYDDDLQDCSWEKDEVFIDWTDPVNERYAERKRVEKFGTKKLRSFYCQNLVAKDRLEADGVVQSEGSFQLYDADQQYLVFSIQMGDLTYKDKLYIHVGPRQKLTSSK